MKAVVRTGNSNAVTDDSFKQYPIVGESWPNPSHSLVEEKSKANQLLLHCRIRRQLDEETAAEAHVRVANDRTMATCALRPSVIYGPRDHQMIPSLHACIAKGETLCIIGDGLDLWDVTYVADAADAHVLALENLLSTGAATRQVIMILNEQLLLSRDFCLAVWKELGYY